MDEVEKCRSTPLLLICTICGGLGLKVSALRTSRTCGATRTLRHGHLKDPLRSCQVWIRGCFRACSCWGRRFPLLESTSDLDAVRQCRSLGAWCDSCIQSFAIVSLQRFGCCSGLMLAIKTDVANPRFKVADQSSTEAMMPSERAQRCSYISRHGRSRSICNSKQRLSITIF